VVLVLALAMPTGCAGLPSPCLPIWLVVDGGEGAASLANNGGGPRIPLASSEDWSDASSHRADWIFVFRKALSAKFIVRSMPGDCWIWCIRSCTPMFSI
jgi:hypothetical protein